LVDIRADLEADVTDESPNVDGSIGDEVKTITDRVVSLIRVDEIKGILLIEDSQSFCVDPTAGEEKDEIR